MKREPERNLREVERWLRGSMIDAPPNVSMLLGLPIEELHRQVSASPALANGPSMMRARSR